MAYYIVDYLNEDIEGPFKNKDALIDYLAYQKLGDMEVVSSYKEAKEFMGE